MRNYFYRVFVSCMVLLLLYGEAAAINMSNEVGTNLIDTDNGNNSDFNYITTDTNEGGDSDVAMAGDADEYPAQAIRFTDVPSGAWYVNYVSDLSAQGIIGGFDDGTFRPDDEVTYAQALKMIMMAAGYPEQQPTSGHWASGYLDCAVSNSLLGDKSVDLDQKINRYVIAELTAKALNLSLETKQESPFSDMSATISFAPYVLALYHDGIVAGSSSPTGGVTYNGESLIKRSEICAIIWRINDYSSKR